MQTIKVFTAFSGYDSQMMALQRVAERHEGMIGFDLVGWSEIDKLLATDSYDKNGNPKRAISDSQLYKMAGIYQM